MSESAWLILLVIAGVGALIAGRLSGTRRHDPETLLAAIADGHERLEREIREELARIRRDLQVEAAREREARNADQHRLGQAVAARVAELGAAQGERLDAFARQLGQSTQLTDARLERIRETVDGRLHAIQEDNAGKLEAMRRTVDEKLHATLEQRLGDSFRLVSDRLEQVHRGLGEMQVLANGVGDLKRVLTNVRTRGTWGEVQLGNLLAQILTAEQYQTNVATRPDSRERVEFAICLPGAGGGGKVFLPIDAKFPVEDYHKLLDAQDRADPLAAEDAAKAIEVRLRAEARAIHDKYIEPPYTTDFAILYLPTEGLFAEALRRPALAEALQRDYRVSLAGPTTLAAMLNSLQLGFRTLAIERRSAEVWTVLGAVKTEFGKFGDALAQTRRKLDEAASTIGKAETRSRQLGRRLSEVEALPAEAAVDVLGISGVEPPAAEDPASGSP